MLEFVAGSDTAYRNLWSYLASLDVIGEVKLHGRAVDEPVRWLLDDGRALKQDYCGDDIWLRLLDVPAALSARGYAAPGRVVLEVVDDDLGGYAAGRFALDADVDRGRVCTRTVRLGRPAAAAARAGLRLPRRPLVARPVGRRRRRRTHAGALARADAMFATALRPWNATMF